MKKAAAGLKKTKGAAKKRERREEEEVVPEENVAVAEAPKQKKAKKAKKVDEEPVTQQEEPTEPQPDTQETPTQAAPRQFARKRFQDLSPLILTNVPQGTTEEHVSEVFVAELGAPPARILHNVTHNAWTVFLETTELRDLALEKSPLLIQGAEVLVKMGIPRGAPTNVYIYSVAEVDETAATQAVNGVLGTGALSDIRFLRRNPVTGLGLAVARMSSTEIADKAAEQRNFTAGNHKLQIYTSPPESHPHAVSAWRIADNLSTTDAIAKIEAISGKGTVIDAQVTRSRKGFFVLNSEESYQKVLAAKEFVHEGSVAQLEAVVAPVELRRLFFKNAASALQIVQYFQPLGDRAVVGVDLAIHKDPSLGQGSVVFRNSEFVDKALRMGPIVNGDRTVTFTRDHSKPHRFGSKPPVNNRAPRQEN